MKEKVKALAVHSRPLAKCLAVAKYIERGEDYQRVQQWLDAFVPAEKRTDRRYIRRLIVDMFFSRFYYQIEMGEYFLYQFKDKTDAERRAYIGGTEKGKLCDEIGDAESRRTLADKYECYVFFKEFFGRDIIKVSGPEDKAAFEGFFDKHKEFVVKPIDRSGGKGIYHMDADGMDIDQCFQKVLISKPCVVEQCIEQAYELAQFHPQSVNTVRIATFNNASGIKFLFSMFRTGIGNSFIDNVSAGGIYASVNIENGKIQSDGYDGFDGYAEYPGKGEICQAHPDTGCVFKGFQIPSWPDLLHIVSKAAQAFPQQNYVSWDFALTDSGWVMVEANPRGALDWYQIIAGGIREVFMKEFREYKNQKSM